MSRKGLSRVREWYSPKELIQTQVREWYSPEELIQTQSTLTKKSPLQNKLTSIRESMESMISNGANNETE